ncbi:hypothetical protein PAXRUDRAFT_716361 [Paxillus rubicundulus Ve08.2h10]|uniref:Uncharacterized protein n=1 Tax=Paxillus rubicundulus Ve08.2h10 TaxID=930991 RepID=A0A0D0E2E0_9AGAM|nr:hypothetical protein PAXRUDRAFT_716361 [Paxillus rubicundulus Ve08.2h10]
MFFDSQSAHSYINVLVAGGVRCYRSAGRDATNSKKARVCPNIAAPPRTGLVPYVVNDLPEFPMLIRATILLSRV